MATWKINLIGKKPKLKNPILVEGLPGIGNVGKVAVDFIVDELKAEKLYDIFSYSFPHSVFINEENLVELPSIEIYHKKMPKQDLLFLAGDVQPTDEVSSYEFCEKMLDLCEEYKVSEIITLGGIGLQAIPEQPKVYCTGNNKRIMERYARISANGVKVDTSLYGVVGPIIGVSGLLLGLAEKRKLDAVALLAETFGHPMYLGIKGSRETIKILNARLGLRLNLKELDKEIEDIEHEVSKKTQEISKVSKQIALDKLKNKLGEEAEYIG